MLALPRIVPWLAAAGLVAGCGGVQRSDGPSLPRDERARAAYVVDPVVTTCVRRWNQRADPLFDRLAASRRGAASNAFVTRLDGRCLLAIPGSPTRRPPSLALAFYVETRAGGWSTLADLLGATMPAPPAVAGFTLARALRRSVGLLASAHDTPNARVRLDGTLAPTDPDPYD